MTDAPPFERAAELRKDLDFLEQKLGDPESLLLPVWRGQALVETATEGPPRLHIATVAEASAWVDAAAELAFLGMLDRRACFAVGLQQHEVPAPPGMHTQPIDLRLSGGRLSDWEVTLGAYARGLLHWHGQAAHCGRCGSPTRPRQGGHVRQCDNSECAAEHFPRTDPAVLVMVTHGDRVLLGRQRAWPRGMYSCLAGFVETGESAEEAVVREVLEESGVPIADLRYVRSQAWPFPSSLMLGFSAEAQDDRIAPTDDELEDLRWVSRAALNNPAETGVEGFFVPPRYALAGEMLADFAADGRQGD